MNLLARDEFIKASPAIQIQGNLTHLQRRAWNVLLANAYDELPNKEIHRVSIVDLAKKLGFESRNQNHLKDMLRSLAECVVEWNVLGKSEDKEWSIASLLASARIKDGICTYAFAPHLRLKLYNPRIYAKLNLRLQNRFTDRHALILWEICFDYFDSARDQGETPFIPLNTFRELMGVAPDEYPAFKTLNQCVIKPAVKEINALTNFFVEVEQKRVGRKVGFLKFQISRPLEISRTEEMEFTDLNIHDLPPIALELVQAGVGKDAALNIANQQWGAVNTDALPQPSTYPDFAAYVDEKIWIARAATDIKNIGGFIVQAIRKNYQDPEVQKQRSAEKEKEQQALVDTLKAERDERVTVLLQQTVREQPQLLEAASEKLAPYPRQRLEDYDSVQEAYQNDIIVAAILNDILAEKFCQELLAPVYQAYEDEKARILGEIG